MRALKFISPLLLIATSFFFISGITSTPTAHSYSSMAQGSLSAPTGANIDGQQTRNDSASPPESVSPLPSELPISDPYADKQWALSRIQAPKLWPVTEGAREILVAVLDTGIDRNHEDLAGQVVAEVNLTDSATLDDIYGHGTHVAGIIAANNNSLGVVGMAPKSRLMNVKVANDKGRCQASVVAKGVIWAVDNGASVINISVELREPSSELEDAINYAWNRGAVVVVAAGNDGSQLPVYPAYYENSIAVAATTQDDSLAPLSNYGDWVDVAAPGFNIYSTLPDNRYGYKSGTSFAAPYVSGLAALLFNMVADNNDDGRLNDEVRAAIEKGCQIIDVSGVDWGRIDAANSMAAM